MRREELYLADLMDNARAVRGYLDGVTRERWDAEDILRDAVLYRMLLLGEVASALPGALRDNHPEVAWRQIRAFRRLPGPYAITARARSFRRRDGHNGSGSGRKSTKQKWSHPACCCPGSAAAPVAPRRAAEAARLVPDSLKITGTMSSSWCGSSTSSCPIPRADRTGVDNV
jgi:Protein of unknown function DUF86